MTQKGDRWRDSILPAEALLGDVIENLNSSGLRVVLCVDKGDRFLGLATDGDLRRGLLRGLTMKSSIADIVNLNPLFVREGTDRQTVRSLMTSNRILQIPVISSEGHLVGLHLWDDLGSVPEHEHAMVIMAGGKGVRLRPFTENCPKPMLHVGGKPMLQHIIERAKTQGFKKFVLSVNYLGQMIQEHFKDGSDFGVEIIYAQEDKPLGTAGALSLIGHHITSDFIVTNGDVLADVDYFDLINFRQKHDAHGAMAVRLYEWTNPYGVVRMQGADIIGFTEKPVVRSHINAGIYAFTPASLAYLQMQEHCDMPSLFDRLREAGHRTVAYPLHEPWLDVGRPDDLDRANAEFSDEIECSN
jgi:dTDP-glucose pyrophosphorylase